MIYSAKTPSDLAKISSDLISRYPNGTTVLLVGTLASGKSTLVSQIATDLGIEQTSSPTFGIMHEYAPNFRHYDLYRVGSDGFFAKGLHESLEDGWNMIEWADERVEKYLIDHRFEFVKITIDLMKDSRNFEVTYAD